MKSNKLPNFLIVGAAKSGTTSLFIYLRQHPEIFMPINKYKEPKFFTSDVPIKLAHKNLIHRDIYEQSRVTNFEKYLKIFENVSNEKAIGEASTAYLYFYNYSIHNIKNFLGDVRIIVILRNPVDRAFSSYKHLLMDDDEVLSFEKCLKLENHRKRENWPILYMLKDAGLYYEQVKAFKSNFNNVKIILYDEFKKSQLYVIKDIFNYLQVDEKFTPDISRQHNVSGIPLSKDLHRVLVNPNHTIKKILRPVLLKLVGKKYTEDLYNSILQHNFKNISMRPETREYLKDYFREDIIKLQDLISRDLSHWLD